MHHPSRYNVRSLLGVTTLAALVLLPIVKPSVWWTLLFPAASSLVVVRTVSLFVVTAERCKVFWACFAAGQLLARELLPTLKRLRDTDSRIEPGWWSIADEASDAISAIRGLPSPDRTPLSIISEP